VREGKIERTKETKRGSFKTTEAEISIATTLSVVEEARNTSSVDDNSTCSDKRSREDKCSSG